MDQITTVIALIKMWRNIYPPRTVEISSHLSSNSFYLCVRLSWYKTGLSLSISAGLDGLRRHRHLSVLLSVHQTVWSAVCQRGTVRPVLQSCGSADAFAMSPVFHANLCGVLSPDHLSVCAGRSPDHIVCCLSRDSYGTSVFLQELMSALSLQQQLPPPEPSDQDFYSQFTNTNTGAETQHNSLYMHNSFCEGQKNQKCSKRIMETLYSPLKGLYYRKKVCATTHS